MDTVFYAAKADAAGLQKILDSSGIENAVKKGDNCAIKTHFGEKGNKGYIRNELIKLVAGKIKTLGAGPFVTDTCTMYKGERGNAVRHLNIALEHGFSHEKTGCPVIIAGGLNSTRGTDVEVNGKHFKKAQVADEIFHADSMVFTSHVKGHVLAGLGGAVKNISMGCATLSGKYSMHNTINPAVKTSRCTGCGLCVRFCPAGALSISDKKTVVFDAAKCAGCGECLHFCVNGVFSIPWNESASNFQEKMAEFALAVTSGKRCFYINILNYVTKDCDCMASSGKPLIEDAGIAAGTDPVSVDQASLDILNKAFGSDLFRHLRPEIDHTVQLEYGQKIGLGSRQYKLMEI